MSRRQSLMHALEYVRTTLARVGAAELLDLVETRNAGEIEIPTSIANVAAPSPAPSPELAAASTSATPRLWVRIHGWSKRPDVKGRIFRYHAAQRGGAAMGGDR